MNQSGRDVWVYVEHLRGAVAEHTYELLGKGRELAGALGGRLVAIFLGEGVHPLTDTLGAADSVLCVEDAALAGFTPQAHASVLRSLAEQQPPRLLLFGATSMGMDLASLLSTTLRMPLVVNCRDICVEDHRIIATNQMCGGKLLCQAEIADAPAIFTVLPGAFPAAQGKSDHPPAVQRIATPVPLEGLRTRFVRLLEPAAGDVDITKAPVLVAVGRGIQRQDNLALAEELAGLLGGAVCASRPVIDQGWLPVTRQVGKSGMIVKPRFYLALGISGASEHIEGMKGSELVVAINSDPKAPIFEVADYGVVADMFDIIPALLGVLRARKGLAA
ncbi:MAG: electron transfer flavoprotein subunit alpha/FixB family protein [Armatimonadota bacterium]|nr:electron transfer flavoprotein subunit alpha/FixB family protein [Armatimonadota bacterium]MDR7484008.1 electron transfer flavoprotein subunit alpha/FixB family protein [Armatimonadota bacterium]MDR7518720.1 electron transfer flavoprotein subunit alpha/FixB family protein [Armatimonadota bacterium]MDR7550024.1 electron transfer flavoprotein subunit alpha/FixB family protein [Armatimonadota bacterium]